MQPHVAKIEKNFQKWQQNVNKSLATIGGGGSNRLMQNADVEYKRSSNVDDNMILVFHSDRKKFVTESLQDLIDRIEITLETKYDKLVDDAAPYVYIGEAAPGSTPAAAAWRIKRVYEDSNGDLEIRYANADTTSFSLIWEDRTTYSYV